MSPEEAAKILQAAKSADKRRYDVSIVGWDGKQEQIKVVKIAVDERSCGHLGACLLALFKIKNSFPSPAVYVR